MHPITFAVITTHHAISRRSSFSRRNCMTVGQSYLHRFTALSTAYVSDLFFFCDRHLQRTENKPIQLSQVRSRHQSVKLSQIALQTQAYNTSVMVIFFHSAFRHTLPYPRTSFIMRTFRLLLLRWRISSVQRFSFHFEVILRLQCSIDLAVPTSFRAHVKLLQTNRIVSYGSLWPTTTSMQPRTRPACRQYDTLGIHLFMSCDTVVETNDSDVMRELTE